MRSQERREICSAEKGKKGGKGKNRDTGRRRVVERKRREGGGK